MTRKPVVKVSFAEDSDRESYYFLKRLMEKILLDHIDPPLEIKGALIKANSNHKEKNI